MGEKKVVITQEVKSPHCKKYLEVKHTKKTLSEPEPGEYEHKIEISKSTQTRLKGERYKCHQ